MIVVSKNIVDTRKVAKQVLDYVEKKKKRGGVSGAMVVGLYGELGAGKTAFVKEFAKVMGIKENVPSPTFAIMKKYQSPIRRHQVSTNPKFFKNLIHIDAYRLENSNELEQLGWSEIIKNSENIVLIEWTERVKEILPSDMIKIYFEFVDEETRRIKVSLKRNES